MFHSGRREISENKSFCRFTEMKCSFSLLQGKIEQMTDIIKRLKVCVKWFQQVDETHVQEKESLRSSLESAEKRCSEKGDFAFPLCHVCLHINLCSLNMDVVPNYFQSWRQRLKRKSYKQLYLR